MTKLEQHEAILGTISASRMYQDYANAFMRGTGLPLSLHEPHQFHLTHFDPKQENPFCALMARTNQSCAGCYAIQQRLETVAQFEPRTLKCFAGLCETAVPVRVAGDLVAFLHTGQILLHRPNKTEFNQIARTLLSLGTDVDLKKVEEAYFNSRVLSAKQYEALIRLLTIFAEHLAECSQVLLLQSQHPEPPAIARARAIIADVSANELSLNKIARAVNMSASYFSAKFKEVTGINFVTYVARIRIEKAKSLLQNPGLRISEIAFEAGFKSLSQFNRAFKGITGQAPGEFRRLHGG